MKVKEAIELINNREDLYYVNDAGKLLLKDKTVEEVATHIESDAHRWFEIATNVYKCEDGFVGVRGVARLFSEQMLVSDTDVPCQASEYEEIQTISYREKR